jgi:hypothetical protein
MSPERRRADRKRWLSISRSRRFDSSRFEAGQDRSDAQTTGDVEVHD